MKSHTLRNSLLGILILLIVLSIAVLVGVFRSSSVAPQAKQPLSDA